MMDVLDDMTPSRILVVSDEPVEVAGPLAERFPSARLHVVAATARDLSLAMGDRVVVAAEFPRCGWADFAVLRISGYEGTDRLHARIAEVHQTLREGSRLMVITHTRRGAKRQSGMLEQVFGNAETLGRGSGGVRILSAVRSGAGEVEETLQRNDQRLLEETVLGEHFAFRSGATVFSRERLDWGTRLLLETVEVRGARRLLDLGCGYGPIGIVLARVWPALVATLVDVDVEAVRLAQENARLNGVADRIRVVLSDGLRGLPPGERFDLVLTHFPLHIPRHELVRILTEAHNALEPGGRLCGVALSAYDVRASVRQAFGNVATIAETTTDNYPFAFRVVCANRG